VPDDESSLLDLTVRELLDAVADRTTAPGGGGAAALATAVAAALTGMAARFSDAGPVAAEADDLRTSAAPLADADAVAYRAYLTATRLPRDDPDRSEAVAAARADTIAVPAEIGRLAGAVAGLAAGLVRDGNPNLRSDAVAAVHLAAAAADTAAELVAANNPPEDTLARARAIAAAARERVREVAPTISG
jgi:formiminotetrahydrofolate cyclodeaminase